MDKKKENNNILFSWNTFLTIFLFNFAPKELIAPEDRGAFFVIVKAPQGSGFNFTKTKAEEIEKLLLPKVGEGEYRKLIMRVPGFWKICKTG